MHHDEKATDLYILVQVKSPPLFTLSEQTTKAILYSEIVKRKSR